GQGVSMVVCKHHLATEFAEPDSRGLVPGIHVDSRDMCGWPPARKDFSGVSAVRSLAVMCPACVRGRWPQAVMGSVDRGLIKPAGSRCPMSRYRFASIRRSTDAAITLFHLASS